MNSLAIVIPWFSEHLKGGAEQHAWQVANRLAARGHKVEVLTTCCETFQKDWSHNHLKPGISQIGSVKVHRFPVQARNDLQFNAANAELMQYPKVSLKPGVSPISAQLSEYFVSDNIKSPKLLKHLEKNSHSYDAFLFLPYLYGPILQGIFLVKDKAFLQPCLHDESYAYLPHVADIFHAAKGLLFISDGEAQLARKLYGPGIALKSFTTGAGIEAGFHFDEKIHIVKNFKLLDSRFILCLGRRDSTKNTDLLICAFSEFKRQFPASDLKLVLAGPGVVPAVENANPEIVDLALVTESEKEALLSHCLALFQPSQNESYSRVMMEAWFYQRPVVVHRDCLATALAVKASGGGWLAGPEQEWAEQFSNIDTMVEADCLALGLRGQQYAAEHADWDKVLGRYEQALGLLPSGPISPSSTPQRTLAVVGQTETEDVAISASSGFRKVRNWVRGRIPQEGISPTKAKVSIHQLLPGFAYGDAISNQALAIRDYLRQRGYSSEIYALFIDERLNHEAHVFSAESFPREAHLIYHHSIGSSLTDYAVSHTASKCLIYHNITPAHFFEKYDPGFAAILEEGRRDLTQLSAHFPVTVGDSEYNANELIESGFSNSSVLPIIVSPQKWDRKPDSMRMQKLQDGRTNILFVGRVAPNKRQDDLLKAFSIYLKFDPQARLIFVGSYREEDQFYNELFDLMIELGIRSNVLFTGHVEESELLAFYRTAHLFWSMSEHEGFGVPLVESMWFDIPILAYKSSAVPETLGPGGILFNQKEDLMSIAALAHLMLTDDSLRAKVIDAQRQQRKKFLLSQVRCNLDELIDNMVNTEG